MQKNLLQNDFRPEYAEDISCVCFLNQIFESVSDLFIHEGNIQKDRNLSYIIVCVFMFY